MSAGPSEVFRMRWTPSNIRKTIRYPKPKGARRRYFESVAEKDGGIGRLLAHILAHSDIIDDGRPLPPGSEISDHRGAWLLVPLPADLLDQLLEIGVEQADLEPDPDIEPDQDGEASLGANEAVPQVYSWALPPDYDLENDDLDEGGEDDEVGYLPASDDVLSHPQLGHFHRL